MQAGREGAGEGGAREAGGAREGSAQVATGSAGQGGGATARNARGIFAECTPVTARDKQSLATFNEDYARIGHLLRGGRRAGPR